MGFAAPPAGSLLGPGDPAPVGVRNGDAASPLLLICDHAGNAVPAALGTLGLGAADLGRHIGYDIGILPVSERLSDALGAPLVFQRYSRLVAECNRLFAHEESIALASDGTPIPGNAGLARGEGAWRVAAIVEPYHREIARRLDARGGAGLPTVLVSMHSFTPSLRSRPFDRPCHIGLCFGEDDRFTRAVLTVLEREAGLTVGRNEPYAVNMAKDYSIPIHGEARGLPYAEFEIRQDLIDDPSGQAAWAERLARVLTAAHDLFERHRDA